MAKKIRRNRPKINSFNLGGLSVVSPKIDVTKIGEDIKNTANSLGNNSGILEKVIPGLSPLSSITGSSIGMSKLRNVDDITNQIDTVNNTNLSGINTYDSLIDTWNNTKDINNVNWRDLTGSKGEKFGNTLNNTISGVSSGASIGGPIGAIAGGIVGLGSSIAGIFTGNKKAKRKARQLNEQIDAANLYQTNNLINQADSIDKSNDLAILSTLYKDGGSIHIKPENKGKFTSYCGGKVTNECIQKGLNSTNPTIRKRANFARNARKWNHADGGEINEFNNGGTHEENPLGGIPISKDIKGIPNMVEEGEVKYKDYIFSNRLKPNNMKNKTFADIAKKINKEAKERPNDFITKNGVESNMSKLRATQEEVKDKKEFSINKFSIGGKIKERLSNIDSSYLRYAPIVGSTIDYTKDLFGANKPDYSRANELAKSADNLVDTYFTPLTQKMDYKPFDINYATNKLNAQAGATRRAIVNNSGGIRGAALSGLLASDYNTQNQLGDLTIKADEYNRMNKERALTFNRATDQFNREGQLRADSFNRENALQRINARRQALQMKEMEDLRVNEAKNIIKSNFFGDLGAFGREQYDRNTIGSLDASRYKLDSRGKVIKK